MQFGNTADGNDDDILLLLPGILQPIIQHLVLLLQSFHVRSLLSAQRARHVDVGWKADGLLQAVEAVDHPDEFVLLVVEAPNVGHGSVDAVHGGAQARPRNTNHTTATPGIFHLNEVVSIILKHLERKCIVKQHGYPHLLSDECTAARCHVAYDDVGHDDLKSGLDVRGPILKVRVDGIFHELPGRSKLVPIDIETAISVVHDNAHLLAHGPGPLDEFFVATVGHDMHLVTTFAQG